MKPVVKTLAILSFPLALAACGSGGDQELLVEMCMEDGDSRSTCECQVDVVMEDLSDDHKKMMIDMARMQKEEGMNEQDAQKELMEKYDMGQLMSFGMAMIGPMAKAEEKC